MLTDGTVCNVDSRFEDNKMSVKQLYAKGMLFKIKKKKHKEQEEDPSAD